MTRSTTIWTILWCAMAVPWITARADDAGAELVLGTTIVLRQDGTIVRIPERDALAVPWTGTASGVTIGGERGCALAWPLASAPRAIGRAIWLADGQCLPGAIDPSGEPEPGMVRWRAGPMLMSLPLSALRAWTAVGIDVPAGAIDADRVTLRNGDTVDGLVTSLGSTVTIDSNGTTRTFDDELIASIQFVQAGDAPADPGRLRVWIDDGAIIDADTVERDGTLLQLKVPLPGGDDTIQIRLRIDQVLGMATPALSRTGVSLRTQSTGTGLPGDSAAGAMAIPPSTSSTVDSDGAPASSMWSTLPGIMPSVDMAGPGRLGSMQAMLRGPGSWSMPITTEGVLVSQVLVPDRARSVADHTLVIRQSGVELARIESRSDTRSMRVPVKPGTVEFDLVPGKAGPVGCVMELVDLVLIRSGS